MGLRVRCEINFEVDSRVEFGQRAGDWVLGGAEGISGDLTDRVAGDPHLFRGRMANGIPLGPEGAEWGFVARTLPGSGTNYGKTLDRKTTAWARKEAATGGIDRLSLGFSTLDSHGHPGQRIIRFEAELVERRTPWVCAWFEAPEERLLDPKVQSDWLSFVRGFADGVNPSYGQISYVYDVPSTTALETVTGPPWTITYEAIHASREVLRGYDWLTICDAGLTARLGGAQKLRDSGAFAEVETLDSGGTWLLATHRYQDYTGDRVEGVWRTLAPVLKTGMPRRDEAARYDEPFRLVFRDAAEMQP